MTLYVVGGIILVLVAALWMFARRMRQSGEATVIAEVAVETVKVTQAMAEAQANAPSNKQEVLDRLRTEGGL